MGFINQPNISGQSIRETYDTAIELVSTRPDTGVLLSVKDTPGRLFGYYDGAIDCVRLYIIDRSGYRVLPI